MQEISLHSMAEGSFENKIRDKGGYGASAKGT